MQPNDYEFRLQKLKLHFIYCAIIAGIIMIVVMTNKWTESEKFTDYLTSAGTMTSIVLAMVAIVYAIYSNDGLLRSLSSISNIAAELNKSREEMGQLVITTEDVTKKFNESADLVKNLSNKVASGILSMREAVSVVGKHTEELHKEVGDLPAKFGARMDALQQGVIDKIGSHTASSTAVASKAAAPSNDFVAQFLTISSVAGLFILYACSLSLNSKKALEPNLITKFGAINVLGFVVATRAANMLDYEIDKSSKETAFKINRLAASAEEIKEACIKRINLAFSNDEPGKALYIAQIDEMKALLA